MLTVSKQDERRLQSDYVIDSSGRRAAFARTQGARSQALGDTIAIVRWLPTSSARAELSEALLVEALPFGWGYACRTPNNAIVVGYMLPKPRARRPRSWAASAWDLAHESSRLIAGHLRPRLPAKAPLRVYPAWPGRLEPMFGSGWMAIGDAAVHFDPLEGQGVAPALGAGMRAAEICLAGANWCNEALRSQAEENEKRMTHHLETRSRYLASQ